MVLLYGRRARTFKMNYLFFHYHALPTGAIQQALDPFCVAKSNWDMHAQHSCSLSNLYDRIQRALDIVAFQGYLFVFGLQRKLIKWTWPQLACQ